MVLISWFPPWSLLTEFMCRCWSCKKRHSIRDCCSVCCVWYRCRLPPPLLDRRLYGKDSTFSPCCMCLTVCPFRLLVATTGPSIAQEWLPLHPHSKRWALRLRMASWPKLQRMTTPSSFIHPHTLSRRNGDYDTLHSPSARLVMGQVVMGGTGCFELCQPLADH